MEDKENFVIVEREIDTGIIIREDFHGFQGTSEEARKIIERYYKQWKKGKKDISDITDDWDRFRVETGDCFDPSVEYEVFFKPVSFVE